MLKSMLAKMASKLGGSSEDEFVDGITPYKGGKQKTPTGKSNEFSYDGGLDSYMKEAEKRGLDVSDVKTNEDLQSKVYDSLMSSEDGQNILKNMWIEYGDTIKGSGKKLPSTIGEKELADLKSSFVDGKLGARTQMILEGIKPISDDGMDEKPSESTSYSGEPVYLPGVKGATGGNITNALVGFLKNGEFQPISESDFKKYAVPKWAQESMAKGGVDEYLKSKLGDYYKGVKRL